MISETLSCKEIQWCKFLKGIIDKTPGSQQQFEFAEMNYFV